MHQRKTDKHKFTLLCTLQADKCGSLGDFFFFFFFLMFEMSVNFKLFSRKQSKSSTL